MRRPQKASARYGARESLARAQLPLRGVTTLFPQPVRRPKRSHDKKAVHLTHCHQQGMLHLFFKKNHGHRYQQSCPGVGPLLMEAFSEGRSNGCEENTPASNNERRQAAATTTSTPDSGSLKSLGAPSQGNKPQAVATKAPQRFPEDATPRRSAVSLTRRTTGTDATRPQPAASNRGGAPASPEGYEASAARVLDVRQLASGIVHRRLRPIEELNYDK